MATHCRDRVRRCRIRAWKRKGQWPRLNGRQSTIIAIRALPGMRLAMQVYPILKGLILNGLLLRGLTPKNPLSRDMPLLAKPAVLPGNRPGSGGRTGAGRTPRFVPCSLAAAWTPSPPLPAIARLPWRARSRLPALVRHHMAAADMADMDMLMVDRDIIRIMESTRAITPVTVLLTTILPISMRRLISAPIIAGC